MSLFSFEDGSSSNEFEFSASLRSVQNQRPPDVVDLLTYIGKKERDRINSISFFFVRVRFGLERVRILRSASVRPGQTSTGRLGPSHVHESKSLVFERVRIRLHFVTVRPGPTSTGRCGPLRSGPAVIRE